MLKLVVLLLYVQSNSVLLIFPIAISCTSAPSEHGTRLCSGSLEKRNSMKLVHSLRVIAAGSLVAVVETGPCAVERHQFAETNLASHYTSIVFVLLNRLEDSILRNQFLRVQDYVKDLCAVGCVGTRTRWLHEDHLQPACYLAQSRYYWRRPQTPRLCRLQLHCRRRPRVDHVVGALIAVTLWASLAYFSRTPATRRLHQDFPALSTKTVADVLARIRPHLHRLMTGSCAATEPLDAPPWLC